MEPWHGLSSRLLPCYYQHIFNCLALEYNSLCDDSTLVYFYRKPIKGPNSPDLIRHMYDVLLPKSFIFS